MTTPRVLLIGGFLGAGKTTALCALAPILRARGERVAVVTNDQAAGLVDTALVAADGFPVGEVVGACFCCDLHGLTGQIDALLKDGATTILAEPVGSCTDLVATVVRPLERAYGDRVRILPLSVLVDPARLATTGADASIDWLVQHQLEEADVVVVTKDALLDDAGRDDVVARLEHALPGRATCTISAAEGRGLEAWLAHLENTAPLHRWLRDIDYAKYAAAEAALAWLNADVDVTSAAPVPPAQIARGVVEGMRTAIGSAGAVVGNLKAFVRADVGWARAGVTSSWSPVDVVGQGGSSATFVLTVNARATTSPEELSRILDDALAATLAGSVVARRSAFRPAPPVPTQRIVGA